MSKSRFIVIDGTDGAGKETQTKILVERLTKEGYAVEVGDFPQYGERSAAMVEDYLNKKFGTAMEVGPYRASIFYACDRYAASFKFRKWLDEGKIIVSNRYVSANMGHQAGKIKDKEERDKFLAWLDNLEYGIFGIPRPDLTILLYTPPAIGQELVGKKGKRDYIGNKKEDIHEADIQHLTDAADAYRYVAEKYNWITIECTKLDNTLFGEKRVMRAIDNIAEEIWNKIKDKI